MGRSTPLATPVVETRVGLEGGLLDSGDIEVRPGVGVVGTRPGAGLVQLDTNPAELPNPVGLFAAGALSARTIATLRNRRSTILLRQIEANCGILPGAGVDAANHYRLRVAGALSGAVDLPINVAAQRYFLLDGLVAGFIARQITATSTGAPTSGFALAMKFRPSAALVVTGAGFFPRRIGATPANSVFAGVPKRMRILSADRQTELATSGTFLDSFPLDVNGEQLFSKDMQAAVALDQATDYWLTIEMLDGESRVQAVNMNSWSGSNLTEPPLPVQLRTQTVAGDIQGPVDGVNVIDYGAVEGFQLYLSGGAGAGVELSGDLTVSSVLTGAAPGAPGGDVNLGFLFG